MRLAERSTMRRAMAAVHRAALHKAAYAALMIGCAAWAAVQTALPTTASSAASSRAPVEWPTTWDGRALRPLAFSDVEQRFAAQFPGRLARMTDGSRQFVLREVEQPTRMLHPAVDCYRALGYRIADARLEDDAQQRRWRCFDAWRDGHRVRVCERIVDADGATYTDTSSWFWAALLGRSRGPWQAVTTAQPS